MKYAIMRIINNCVEFLSRLCTINEKFENNKIDLSFFIIKLMILNDKLQQI